MAWVRHHIARKHPVTGRTALYAVSGSSFAIEGMPEAYVVDRQGRVRIEHRGFRKSEFPALREEIEKLLQEKSP